ncbi:hypothetical protein CCR75_001687 [Bremia lactucae]|uniref:Uncharacterized protein n=1 Tax=Bremia lactucae TaxID=4779 RepID=A0A976FEG3_BRELC|nr:hypothetical protein CCR75_001687 [Bremia lactucae]
MANMTEVVSRPQDKLKHHLIDDCPHAVALTMIQRHRNNRQRFDSADYEMSKYGSSSCAGCSCNKGAPLDGNDFESEPEPGSTNCYKQLRCLRLQRFDSADWVLQTQCTQQSLLKGHLTTNMAQKLIDRHALKRCAFVGPVAVRNTGHSAIL